MTDNIFLNIDKDLAAKLALLDQSEGVRLPFPVAYGYWLNGAGARKQIGHAAYFGGWAFDAPGLETAADEIAPIPPTFTYTELVNRDGGEFFVYATRWLAVAPIAKRQRFVQTDPQVNPKKGHTHLQILAYIATYDDEGKGYISWGPAVLSSKGYASNYVRQALAKWDSGTAAARREHTGNLPSKLFYAPIGTFGKAPGIEQVGKDQKSPITPAQVHLPEKVTLDYLRIAYVGAETAARMYDLGVQAQEWLGEWAKRKDAKDAKNDASANIDAEDDGFIPF